MNSSPLSGAERAPRTRLLRTATAFATAAIFATPTPATAQTTGRGADPASAALNAAADRGRILGAESARLWMLVVSDFQCPFCRQWHDETWGAIRREFVETGKIRVAYLNFPLGQHTNARPAAIVSMCAAAQGKFWPVADALFATQDRWKDLTNPGPFFAGITRAAGVDAAAERACMSGGTIPALVEADRTRMARAGAQSTPTFYIGSSRLDGAQPIEVFRRVFAAELAKLRP